MTRATSDRLRVIDVFSMHSLREAQHQHCLIMARRPNVRVILVGTQSDQEIDISVAMAAKEYALTNSMAYIETR
jgi:hypothetical protein